MSEEAYPRVLYVGNLDTSVTEELILTLFGRLGACKGCKFIRELGSDPYAFVEFEKHSDARLAMAAMNRRELLGREVKVNWATSPGQAKVDISKHYHVFVGDLSPDIDSHHLREAFAPFGAISDCKIICDPHTNVSKGYGFVCFFRREDADMAITGMNGQWLGGKAIRTNWANGKLNANATRDSWQNEKGRSTLKYEDVYNQSGPNNCTVYCGGVQAELTEQLMRDSFSEFGTILDIKVFKDKAFAFIRFDSKDAAAKAIVAMSGTHINGFTVKCSWGKEPSNSAPVASSTPPTFSSQPVQPYTTFSSQPVQPYTTGYGAPNCYGQMGYWGFPPQGYYSGSSAGYVPGTPQQSYVYASYSQQQYTYGAGAMPWQPPAPSQQLQQPQ